VLAGFDVSSPRQRLFALELARVRCSEDGNVLMMFAVLLSAAVVGACASSETYQCDPPLKSSQSIGLVIGTIAGAAIIVTLASFMAGLAPIAQSREDTE
jgi:hypothetical protein